MMRGDLPDEGAASRLEDDYAAAWDEWDVSEDSRLWGTTVADGTTDAPTPYDTR